MLLSTLLVLAFGAASLGASCSANTKAVVTQSIAQAIQCVTAQVVNGSTDPANIAAACSGVAIEDVIAIVEAIIAGSAASGDGGAPPALSSEMLMKLKAVADKGHALKAAK